MEPDEPEFMTGGYLAPLDDVIDLANLNDWAKQAWSYKGHVYGLPAEAYTVEIYYNKSLLKKVGTVLPASAQLSQDQFADMVKRAAAAGITAVVDGVGDQSPARSSPTRRCCTSSASRITASCWTARCPTRTRASSRR